MDESNSKVAEGAAVLLPVTVACHTKRGFTIALLVELYAEVSNLKSWEL